MAAVLCVDDSDVALRIRKMLLETAGHTVITACTAEQAISLFQLAHFDLVLCDYYLPGRTGAEVAVELRALRPRIPFLLISGKVDLPCDLPAVDGVFVKGDSPERLLGLVWEMINMPEESLSVAASA